MRRAIRAVVAASMLGACATATDPGAMRTKAEVAERHPGSVNIGVIGGKETSSAGKSQISNEDFAKALGESIVESGLFRGVAREDAPYRLEVFIARIEQPNFGFNMTVTLEVGYTLRNALGTPLWQRSIESRYTAAAGEAFAGVARLRMATEGAARRNIETAITEMGKLRL